MAKEKIAPHAKGPKPKDVRAAIKVLKDSAVPPVKCPHCGEDFYIMYRPNKGAVAYKSGE